MRFFNTFLTVLFISLMLAPNMALAEEECTEDIQVTIEMPQGALTLNRSEGNWLSDGSRSFELNILLETDNEVITAQAKISVKPGVKVASSPGGGIQFIQRGNASPVFKDEFSADILQYLSLRTQIKLENDGDNWRFIIPLKWEYKREQKEVEDNTGYETPTIQLPLHRPQRQYMSTLLHMSTLPQCDCPHDPKLPKIGYQWRISPYMSVGVRKPATINRAAPCMNAVFTEMFPMPGTEDDVAVHEENRLKYRSEVVPVR